MRPRISLAPRCDIAVTDGILNRIRRHQPRRQSGEYPVLRVFERAVVAAFEFDSDREVVAPGPTAPARCAGVPCAFRARNELHDLSVASHEEVRGHPKAGYAGVIGVKRGVQTIEEKIFDAGSAEHTRGKADRVDDDQVDRNIARTLVEVWRCDETDAGRESCPADAESKRQISFSRQARL